MKRLGLTHATVVAYLALVVALSGTAFAATGGALKLGMVNRAGDTTVLQSKSGSALSLRSERGAPPLRVNGGAKVPRLNADRLDSLDSSELQRRVTGTCDVGTSIRSIDADGSVVCDGAGPVATYERFASAAASGPAGERNGHAAAFCDEGDRVMGGGYWVQPRSAVDVWWQSTVRQLSDPTHDDFEAWEGHDGYEVGWTDDGAGSPATVHVTALCLSQQ